MTKFRKKTFSLKKKDNNKRTKKDKSWDSVYGAGVGAVAGSLGSATIYKNTKRLRENTQDILDEINDKAEDRALDIEKKVAKDGIDKPKDWAKELNGAELHKANRERANKAIKNIKIRKGLAKTGIIAFPILGSVLGSLYGRDNDLRKQRRKMEDAAGDKVAESIKNIGKKKGKS